MRPGAVPVFNKSIGRLTHAAPFLQVGRMHDRPLKSLRRASLWFLPAILLLCACGPTEAADTKPAAPTKSSGGTRAVMETDQGTIEFQLFVQNSPKTVENFRLLAERGFYNGLTFHRVVKGFMIQGGDPEGTGRGGESAWGGTFADEIDRSSALYRNGYRRGMLAMANSGPDTNTSQFFILHQDYTLRPNYTIFGKVTQGIEVVDALASTETTMGPDGNRSRPTKPPVIKKVTILP
jgi:cyclophilin family peptidyl-prolyl cis-trans isomerase